MSEKKEYIERGAFLNWLNKRMDEVGTGKESRLYVNQTMAILKSYPAADVEPVVLGKWIEHLHGGTDEYGYLHETTYYTCSNCGRVVTSTTTRCNTCFAHMERSAE